MEGEGLSRKGEGGSDRPDNVDQDSKLKCAVRIADPVSFITYGHLQNNLVSLVPFLSFFLFSLKPQTHLDSGGY